MQSLGKETKKWKFRSRRFLNKMLVSVVRNNLAFALSSRGVRRVINSCRAYQTGLGDDAFKTTVEVINKQLELGLMVDAYSQAGFRLNAGMSLVGSIALFSRSVLSWKVSRAEEITERTLSLFYLLEPKIDVLVIGYGNKRATGAGIAPTVIAALHRRKIFVEILPTDVACTTFNFLVSEKRFVAGAFIPPESIAITDHDVMATKARNKALFEFDNTYKG